MLALQCRPRPIGDYDCYKVRAEICVEFDRRSGSSSRLSCSTIVAIIMLPLNLVIYTPLVFNGNNIDVMEILDFGALITSLVVVIGAIVLGIYSGTKVKSHEFRIYANKVSGRRNNPLLGASPPPTHLCLLGWELRGSLSYITVWTCLQLGRRCAHLVEGCQLLHCGRAPLRGGTRHFECDDLVGAA